MLENNMPLCSSQADCQSALLMVAVVACTVSAALLNALASTTRACCSTVYSPMQTRCPLVLVNLFSQILVSELPKQSSTGVGEGCKILAQPYPGISCCLDLKTTMAVEKALAQE